MCKFNKNHIDVNVSTKQGQNYRLTGIYGETDRSKRKETWDLVRNLGGSNSLPWCLIGDMNNVLSQTDKAGGRPYPQRLLQGFQDVLNDCDLIDVTLVGYQFTWERGFCTNRHIEIRLDRALVNQEFMNLFQNAKLINLEVSTSDHSPILLETQEAHKVECKKPFRFENAWLREPLCYQLVEDVWTSNSQSSFYEKLTLCSDVLSIWGKEITDNFKGRISQTKKILKTLKGRRDDASIETVKVEKKRLTETYAQQEVFWRQRSKQLWLREGDQNSKLFHAASKNRRKTNKITTLKDVNGNFVN